MPRALFCKTGNAVWISHLDLMRLFQRAFKRAGLPLTHTQGFNPRPSVSIALPLSVGIQSQCELLDFDLYGEPVACEEICRRLNDALVEGVRVLAVYEDGKKIRDLAYLRCTLTLEYDTGVPSGAGEKLQELFRRESLIVEKKGKNGITQQDIIPMIQELTIHTAEQEVEMEAVVCCQNPSLNPMQLYVAVERYVPELVANHVICRRIEIYDADKKEFR